MTRILIAACALLSACGTTCRDTSNFASSANVSSADDSDEDNAVDHSDEANVQQSCASDTVVWVNKSSGVYHMPGERWYGATAHGKYMCQADADDEGDRETENGQ